MTVSIFPETLDLGIEDEAPRGSNTPITIIPEPTDFSFDEETADRPVAVTVDGRPIPPETLPALGLWYAEVRDLFGGFYTTLTDRFTISKLRWELNGTGGGNLSGPILDPGLDALFDDAGNVIDGREIQVGRDDIGVLMHLVPSPRANPRTMEIEGFGPFFHLTRKYVGRNNPPPDLITNGHFDVDVSGWTGVGVSSMTWEPFPNDDLGPGRMVLTSSAAGNFYAEQIVDIPAHPDATFIWLNATIEIDSAVSVRDLATSGRALWTVWTDPPGTTVIWQQGVSPDWRRVGDLQTLSTKIFVPASQHSKMRVRLYVPKGQVKWAAVEARREERLVCDGSPGIIIGCLVAHAQDGGLGKTFVNLDVNDGRGEGSIEINRHYKFAEGANIGSASQEMASLNGGVDFLTEMPAENDRTIFTMERTGWDPGAEKVTLVWGDNLNGFEWTWNPSKRADRGRVQGRGSGDEVTEAFYDDPDSDLGWEFVRRATIEGTPHPEMQAEGLGRTFKRPLTVKATVRRTPTFDVAINLRTSGGGAGALLPGRLVTVQIDHGPVHVDEDFKVLSVEFTPEAETAEMELIPVATLVDE